MASAGSTSSPCPTAIVNMLTSWKGLYIQCRDTSLVAAGSTDPVRGGLAETAQIPQVDAGVVGIDVEAVRAQEADERHPEALGRLDCEVGRRRDGTDDGDPGHGRLLDDLEADAPRHHEHEPVQPPRADQHLRADELVERVVAAHVLADRDQLARWREESGGVEAARLVEGTLRCSQQTR